MTLDDVLWVKSWLKDGGRVEVAEMERIIDFAIQAAKERAVLLRKMDVAKTSADACLSVRIEQAGQIQALKKELRELRPRGTP